MSMDATAVAGFFENLGQALTKPTKLCLIGSAPGIVTGQPDRQTRDVGVWNPGSKFDAADLRAACLSLGILFDPKAEIGPDDIYVQIVRPGIVKLPDTFEPEELGRFGNLTLVMPPPEVIAAAKLVRGSPVDIEDVVWWVKQRGLDASDIQVVIDRFPDAVDREVANANMVFVQLVMGRDWK